jgi:hypothetical protein
MVFAFEFDGTMRVKFGVDIDKQSATNYAWNVVFKSTLTNMSVVRNCEVTSMYKRHIALKNTVLLLIDHNDGDSVL